MRIVILSQVNNEAHRLPHWIKYHASFVHEFFLAIDNPTDNTREVIDALRQQGFKIRTIETGCKDISPPNPNTYATRKLWSRIKDSLNSLFDIAKAKYNQDDDWALIIDPDEYLWFNDVAFVGIENADVIQFSSYNFAAHIGGLFDYKNGIPPYLQSFRRWSEKER